MTSCNGTPAPEAQDKITALTPQVAAMFQGKGTWSLLTRVRPWQLPLLRESLPVRITSRWTISSKRNCPIHRPTAVFT